MLLKNKKIAIIGGGPAGLTLARLLQLQNMHVTVFERDLNQHARVQGSPLDLHQDSGLKALQKSGLLDQFKQHFMPQADRKKIMNEQANVFLSDHDDQHQPKFGDPDFRPEIDRGALRKILLESLLPNTVQWDHQFISMQTQAEGWLLNFNNKRPVYADLVIAADGANSKVRPYLTDIQAFYTGITMLEGYIANAEQTAPQINQLLNGGKIMAFGNQKNLLMGQKAHHEIGFYASFKADQTWTNVHQAMYSDQIQIKQWFNHFYLEWDPIWSELFEHTSLPLIPRPIYCMPLDQTWQTKSNLTLIGDAAHVMPPFAGEGVNVAMLDALNLSEYLCSGQFSSLQVAIAAYEDEMRMRAAEMAKYSLENGERMHAPDALKNMLNFFQVH
ncbi:FAD-dependent monooxygenase [Acinetobacter sp. S40]|uniref:FAD-dependent oxidoreductase n=1 Tax=Acinetobacter sp. S40 TaxID=2767434 RepID=UPI00190AAE8E|nr:NAD(P)/FAD-dependent oxidoreductase [Acinetobacter sp. S40]MBJ9984183.1 FAD-dependent monooxygenase [Acinetobacter sp. S40]